jgi:hypothetical protein
MCRQKDDQRRVPLHGARRRHRLGGLGRCRARPPQLPDDRRARFANVPKIVHVQAPSAPTTPSGDGLARGDGTGDGLAEPLTAFVLNLSAH